MSERHTRVLLCMRERVCVRILCSRCARVTAFNPCGALICCQQLKMARKCEIVTTTLAVNFT